MTTRRFAPRCGQCRQKTMALATVPFDILISHDGRDYDVHIPAPIRRESLSLSLKIGQHPPGRVESAGAVNPRSGMSRRRA